MFIISRYGPYSMDCYEVNLQRFFYTLKQVIPKETLVIWTTALPVARFIRGGFLLDSVNFLTEVLRLDQLLANFFAKQVVDDYGFDVLDLHYIFRNRLSHRRQDGIHWDSFAHRDITFKLVEHICKAWNYQIPNRCHVGINLLLNSLRCNLRPAAIPF